VKVTRANHKLAFHKKIAHLMKLRDKAALFPLSLMELFQLNQNKPKANQDLNQIKDA
jgi:hypothetical protein